MFDPVLVHEYLERSAERFPDKTALVFEQERWTYAQLNQRSTQLATALLRQGLQRGDRVLIFMDNCPEIIVSMYAAMKAGCVFVVLNATIKHAKLAYIMQNSQARMLITSSVKAKVVESALAEADADCNVIWVGKRIPDSLADVSHSWDAVFDDDSKVDSPQVRVIDTDLAALIYTSGSTGDPKGVMSTHRNMVSAARSIIQYVENSKDDIVLEVLPLSFDYGMYQVIMTFMFGGTIVLEKSFVYFHKVLELIAKEGVTGFPIVPTMVAMFLKLKDLDKYGLSSLRYMTNTGAALPVEHIRKLRDMLPDVRIFSMYGLTECKRVSYLPPEDLDRKPSSVGKAMPNCEVWIADEEGKPLPPNTTGELVVRGANVMQGYWRAPEATARAYKPGRYPDERLLFTGDLFRMDEEGYLYFVGRKDELIKSRGERVGTKEVEDALCHIEGVLEAAVIGVPDELLGQAIKAFLVPTPGVELTAKGILRYCTANLETFMVPKHIEIIDELPKTPNGKIDKKILK
jgi:long-chain acyl-CoA synthetase